MGLELLHARDTRRTDRQFAQSADERVLWAVLRALLLSAALGPSVGRLIDRQGGRGLLAASNLVIATGLLILAAAQGGITGLAIAWTVLGVGIGMGLYDPDFAILTWLYGHDAHRSITGITLIAGFVSTIGWPLSALLLHETGWRPACLMWAV